MSSPIVIPANELDIRLDGYLLTNFPLSGTYMNIEKISPVNVYQEGRNGCDTHVRMNGKGYRVTLTMMQGHEDDAFLMAAIALQGELPIVHSFSFWFGTVQYISNSCSLETQPTREFAGDASPPSVYVVTGAFPLVKVGRYNNPTVATADQVAALIPA